MTIAGLSLLTNHGNIKKLIKGMADISLLYVTGFMALIIGILSVLSHNIWSADWRALVTLLGWLTLIKGVVRMLWPSTVVKMIHKFQNDSWYFPAALVTLVLGVYLLYIGFIVY